MRYVSGGLKSESGCHKRAAKDDYQRPSARA